jgi:mannose-6-phosphate isomerase-like protein (cupin superfamily)
MTPYDCLAPDGSEVRLLPRLHGGGMVHCTLHAGLTSLAVRHQTVEELWYVLEGKGQIWRKQHQDEEVLDLAPGVAVAIPLGVHFQFRAIGADPLGILIVTMPPWPGDHEAVRVPDHWIPSVPTERPTARS